MKEIVETIAEANYKLPSNKLIKVVRWDHRCFLNEFLLGITKTSINQHHKNLRYGSHKQYTVFASGVFKYEEKPSPYPPEQLKRKEYLSQHQALTLIPDSANVNVFGHNKDRLSKLVGFIFDPDDALINRMFINDIGSYSRPYEFYSEKNANDYYSSMVLSNPSSLYSDFEAFNNAVIKNPGRCNEVLARVRWNLASSAIGIFSNSFEARCVGQYYAETLKKRLIAMFQEENACLPSDYRVPIYFYLHDTKNKWQVYNDTEQNNDIKLADHILEDETLTTQYFENGNYEFLLIVSNPEKLKTHCYKGVSTLFWLILQGQLHIVDALLKRGKINKTTEEIVYDEIAEIDTVLSNSNPKNKKTSILHVAAETGQLELFKLIQNKLPSNYINALDNAGYAPIHYAAMHGHEDFMNYLLSLPEANINLKDKADWSAMHLAIRYEQIPIVKLLLNHIRVNANAYIKYCSSPFHLAVDEGPINLIKLLLESPNVDTEAKTLFFFSPIAWAKEINRKDVVNLLILHKLNKYITKLEMRKEEYKPRFGGLFWKGHSKGEKLTAAKKLQSFLSGESDDINRNQPSLNQGRLGDIFNLLPG